MPVRILHIVGCMHRGGAETFIMNIYRKIDRSAFQFDFIVHGDKREIYEDEIEEKGGRVIRLKS
jgi:glycosyltransferase EpsF